MITKESLQEAQASVNEALLRIRQSYSMSPSAKQAFFVVEGKDDETYYGVNGENYFPPDWRIRVFPAKNRKKVIETYKSLDWSKYKKERIAFFLDRDLSDYTGEETPIDSNIYITQKYAIENELCTFETYIKTLKYYYDLNDIKEEDEEYLSAFYRDCWKEFCIIAEPIMAQILFWKKNGIHANYANFKMQNTFVISDGILHLIEKYQKPKDVLQDLFKQSNVPYMPMDISEYIELLILNTIQMSTFAENSF